MDLGVATTAFAKTAAVGAMCGGAASGSGTEFGAVTSTLALPQTLVPPLVPFPLPRLVPTPMEGWTTMMIELPS